MMMPRSSRITSLLLIGCVLIAVAGCGRSGPRRVALQGEVKVGGTPLKGGRITFLPTEETKGPAAVATVTEGKFQFTSRTGPVVGKNKVQIEALIDPGFALDDENAYAKAAEEKGEGEAVLPRQPITSDYNERTELLVEVSTGGPRSLEFQVDAMPGTNPESTPN